MRKLSVWLMLLCLPVMLAACGGGGGGGTAVNSTSKAAALTVASNVSVVDPTLSGSVASSRPSNALVRALKAGFSAALAASFSATSDYAIDKTNVYVQERSAEQFNTINNILCMMGQSRYDAMLNQGNYIALVDKNLCDSSRSNASGSGQSAQQSQSSSATMPSYMKFTVNSSRADNSSPEVVKVWIHQPADGNDKSAFIYAYIVISEGTSATNPYGIFAMNFAGFPVAPDGTIGTSTQFKGTLQAVRAVPSDPTSKVLLQFAQTDSRQDGGCGGLVTSSSQVTLDRATDGSGGAGHIKQAFSGGSCSGSSEFDIAFNASDFFRIDLVTAGTPSVCLDRIHFKESAWSYGLYDSNGARVQRDSGFPISYTSSGKTYNGWIGYWGLWIDSNAPVLTNGATVNKVDYHDNSSVPYTVFASGGKLKKHTRKTMTLGDIYNLPLGYFEVSGPTGTNYQVAWDGTHFNKIAAMPQNCNGNCTWANLPAPYDWIHVDHLPWGNLNFWSQNGGGQYQVLLSSCTFTNPMGQPGYASCSDPGDSTAVIFYSEDLVYPGDATVPTTLACYDNCPTVVSGQAVMPVNMMSGPSNTATNYAFDPTALMLRWNGSDIVSTVTNSMQPWGIMTGALFDNSVQSNMDLLACPWNSLQTCTWMAQSVLPVYYTWETGPNNWNQFITIKDSLGAIVTFDPPLQVKYVGTGDPYGALGTTYLLDYSGFGQLNGIPGKCVNMDTGADADCSQGGNGNNTIRWVPQFTIPGMTMVQVTDPKTNGAATDGYVKPLEVEQRMMPDTTPGACSTLVGTDFGAYALPDISIWSNPVASEGAEPSVTAAPAVIGGVVQ